MVGIENFIMKLAQNLSQNKGIELGKTTVSTEKNLEEKNQNGEGSEAPASNVFR